MSFVSAFPYKGNLRKGTITQNEHAILLTLSAAVQRLSPNFGLFNLYFKECKIRLLVAEKLTFVPK